MITCRNCGHSVADGMRFCSACGRPLNAAASTGPVPATGGITTRIDTNPIKENTERQTKGTNDFQTQLQSPPTNQVKDAPVVVRPRKSSAGRAIAIGVSVIVLLGLGSVIAWWVLFHKEEQKKDQPPAVVVNQPNQQPIQNLEPDKAPLPMFIPQAPAAKLEIAERKVVQGVVLTEGDLAGLSRDELRILRNTVYARHGRKFLSTELQRYFERRPWYKARSDYKDSDLTESDRANLALILKKE